MFGPKHMAVERSYYNLQTIELWQLTRDWCTGRRLSTSRLPPGTGTGPTAMPAAPGSAAAPARMTPLIELPANMLAAVPMRASNAPDAIRMTAAPAAWHSIPFLTRHKGLQNKHAVPGRPASGPAAAASAACAAPPAALPSTPPQRSRWRPPHHGGPPPRSCPGPPGSPAPEPERKSFTFYIWSQWRPPPCSCPGPPGSPAVLHRRN